MSLSEAIRLSRCDDSNLAINVIMSVIELPIRCARDTIVENIESYILQLNSLYQSVNYEWYDQISIILERLQHHDCSCYQLAINSVTPVKTVELLREVGFKVVFHHLNLNGYRSWTDLITIVNNVDRPIKININNYILTRYLIQYCQLANIPYQLICDYNYYNSIHWLMELVAEDIDMLDDHNRRVVDGICLRVYRLYDCEYGYILLRQSSYNGNLEQPSLRRNHGARSAISRFDRLLNWIPRIGWSTFNHYRQDINNECYYTHSSLNRYWRQLSTNGIAAGYFNCEHLQSIGVDIPHVNLILNQERINLVKLKRLLPYSTPSRESVGRIVKLMDELDQLRDGHNQYLPVILTIAQYKKSVLYHCDDHPLINHLIEVTSNKLTKSARNIAGE